MHLIDLVFSDLCVASRASESWFKATPDSLHAQPIPVECEDELMELLRVLQAHSGGDDFKITWPVTDGVRLRITRKKVANDETVYICRRYRLPPSPLAELGMPPAVADKLLAPDLTEGLVLFLGKAGSGKTTTLGSFACQRLDKYGGICWTAENPIELPMQGRHGNGMLYQTEVARDEDISEVVSGFYRATPNMILIGEVRDAKTAREAIAAGISGHLVGTTVFAPSLIAGLSGFARLAGGENSSAALSDALRVAVHVSLHNIEDSVLPGAGLTVNKPKGTGTPPRVLSVEPLWMTGDASDALKAMVREEDYHLMRSEVQRQKRSFLLNKLP